MLFEYAILFLMNSVLQEAFCQFIVSDVMKPDLFFGADSERHSDNDPIELLDKLNQIKSDKYSNNNNNNEISLNGLNDDGTVEFSGSFESFLSFLKDPHKERYKKTRRKTTKTILMTNDKSLDLESLINIVKLNKPTSKLWKNNQYKNKISTTKKSKVMKLVTIKESLINTEIQGHDDDDDDERKIKNNEEPETDFFKYLTNESNKNDNNYKKSKKPFEDRTKLNEILKQDEELDLELWRHISTNRVTDIFEFDQGQNNLSMQDPPDIHTQAPVKHKKIVEFLRKFVASLSDAEIETINRMDIKKLKTKLKPMGF